MFNSVGNTEMLSHDCRVFVVVVGCLVDFVLVCFGLVLVLVLFSDGFSLNIPGTHFVDHWPLTHR